MPREQVRPEDKLLAFFATADIKKAESVLASARTIVRARSRKPHEKTTVRSKGLLNELHRASTEPIK
jgi:hypothetical protein